MPLTPPERRAYGQPVVTDQGLRISTKEPLALPIVIRRRRLALGFTQADIANFLGVTQGAVARWESGSRLPGGDHLLQLQRLLSFTPQHVG